MNVKNDLLIFFIQVKSSMSKFFIYNFITIMIIMIKYNIIFQYKLLTLYTIFISIFFLFLKKIKYIWVKFKFNKKFFSWKNIRILREKQICNLNW